MNSHWLLLKSRHKSLFTVRCQRSHPTASLLLNVLAAGRTASLLHSLQCVALRKTRNILMVQGPEPHRSARMQGHACTQVGTQNTKVLRGVTSSRGFGSGQGIHECKLTVEEK